MSKNDDPPTDMETQELDASMVRKAAGTEVGQASDDDVAALLGSGDGDETDRTREVDVRGIREQYSS